MSTITPKFKFYTKQEIKKIKALGSKPSIEDFASLAKEIGRSTHSVQQRFYYTKSSSDKVTPKKEVSKPVATHSLGQVTIAFKNIQIKGNNLIINY